MLCLAASVPGSATLVFTGLVLALLVFDLCVLRQQSHEVTVREAALWTGVWVIFSLLCGAWIGWKLGRPQALEFFTGYVIEYSLSVDNVFLFVLILRQFVVPRELQHHVLFWGVMGALILRGLLIWLGAEMVGRFHWILLLFGALLVGSGLKLLFQKDQEPSLENNPVVRFFRARFTLTNDYRGRRFWITENGQRLLTPLALVLVVVETTDVMFAVDSIPAIFAITTDPFIVFTSNICAILGLRSLYFLVAGLMGQLVYLKYGLALVLLFIGFKMLGGSLFTIPTLVSLIVVTVLIGVPVLLSLLPFKKGG